MKNVTEKTHYLRFERGREFPIFLRIEDEKFLSHVLPKMELLGFKKIDEKIYNQHIKQKKKFHVLKVVQATPQLAQVIKTGPQSAQRYGEESITPFKNYQVYKYQHRGLMVVSPFNTVWELGTLLDPTKDEDLTIFNIMICRFLAMAMPEYNVASFWGVPVEEGIVVMTQFKSKNEMIMVDLEAMNILSVDGVKKIVGDFYVLRLDENLRAESRKMKKEELFSFLTTHTSYLSYHGPNAVLKSLIYSMINFSQGKIYPQDNFMPRTDLPLAS